MLLWRIENVIYKKPVYVVQSVASLINNLSSMDCNILGWWVRMLVRPQQQIYKHYLSLAVAKLNYEM